MPRFVQVLPIEDYESWIAVLDLGPEQAREILNVMDLMLGLDVEYGASKLRLPRFVSPFVINSVNVQNSLDNEGDPYTWAPAEEIEWSSGAWADLENAEGHRVEYISSFVGPNDAYWEIYPKYAPEGAETDYLHRATLEEIAGATWSADLFPILHAWAILRSACGQTRLLYPHDFQPNHLEQLVANINLACGSDREWDYALAQLQQQLDRMPTLLVQSGAGVVVIETPEAILNINRI